MNKQETLFKYGIQEYTGRTVSHLEAHADPVVEGTYAIRAWFDEEGMVDFLFCCSSWQNKPKTSNEVADLLEEAEFTSWPPQRSRFHA